MFKAGCEKLSEDTASGIKQQRPGLERTRELLRQGEVLVVWRLDRPGHTLKHLMELMAQLEWEGIGCQSVQESIDITSPRGKLVFYVIGAMAEFDRNMIKERTQAGSTAAMAKNRFGGRPNSLDAGQMALAVNLYRQRKHTVAETCCVVATTKPTLNA